MLFMKTGRSLIALAIVAQEPVGLMYVQPGSGRVPFLCSSFLMLKLVPYGEEFDLLKNTS